MSTEIGRAAEQAGADWLEAQGYEIVIRNWRSRWAEIDIIARHISVFHIVEVKYRRTEFFGTGFEYVTPDKQGRLRQAAAAWLHETGNSDADYQIDVLSITTKNDKFDIEFLPNAVTDF